MRNIGHKFIFLVIAAFCVSVVTSLVSHAAPESLGRTRAWEAVKDTEKGICYIISFPTRSEGAYTRRDPVYLTVSIRPKENVHGEIGFYAGYPYGTQAVTFTVGDKNHKLTPKGEWAWTKSSNEDAALLKDMIAGNNLVVKGYSQRGTLTTDTFSLSGVTASWNKIKDSCK